MPKNKLWLVKRLYEMTPKGKINIVFISYRENIQNLIRGKPYQISYFYFFLLFGIINILTKLNYEHPTERNLQHNQRVSHRGCIKRLAEDNKNHITLG